MHAPQPRPSSGTAAIRAGGRHASFRRQATATPIREDAYTGPPQCVRAFVIGDRFREEVAAAAPLPAHAFDPCIERAAIADKYQTVAFDTNRYSVPRPWAFRVVTVKGYVDRIVVVAGGRVVAEHPRCYDRSQQVLDPVHFLATLERRPAALDHAPVYRDWRPTAALAGLRRELLTVP